MAALISSRYENLTRLSIFLFIWHPASYKYIAAFAVSVDDPYEKKSITIRALLKQDTRNELNEQQKSHNFSVIRSFISSIFFFHLLY